MALPCIRNPPIFKAKNGEKGSIIHEKIWYLLAWPTNLVLFSSSELQLLGTSKWRHIVTVKNSWPWFTSSIWQFNGAIQGKSLIPAP